MVTAALYFKISLLLYFVNFFQHRTVVRYFCKLCNFPRVLRALAPISHTPSHQHVIAFFFTALNAFFKCKKLELRLWTFKTGMSISIYFKNCIYFLVQNYLEYIIQFLQSLKYFVILGLINIHLDERDLNKDICSKQYLFIIKHSFLRLLK